MGRELKFKEISVGEVIGFWIVLEKGSFKHRQQYWICRCSCGLEKEVGYYSLRTGKSFCCRACVGIKTRFQPKHKEIKVGEKINFWTVLEKGSFKHNQQRWLCRCECGYESEIAQQHLRTGASSKCRSCSSKEVTKKALKRNPNGYSSNFRNCRVKEIKSSLYESQKGVCPICKNRLPSLRKSAWDHDHKTGQGRALVHHGCNLFLGFVERHPGILDNAKQYCERFNINHGPQGSFVFSSPR